MSGERRVRGPWHRSVAEASRPARPAVSLRSEDEDEAFDGRPETVVGSAGSFASEHDDDLPAGSLWVPDPEQRHGWREFYIRRDATPKPGRPMGFGKPGHG